MENENKPIDGSEIQDDWEAEIDRFPILIQLIVRGLRPLGDAIGYLLDGGNARESGKALERKRHDKTR